MFAYLKNEAGLFQMGIGGDEWKVGWMVVLGGTALHQREGNSLFGTLAGGAGG